MKKTMTIKEFAENVFNDCREGAKPMTVEEAANDIANFKIDGWEMPDDFTAEKYAEIWNELV